MTTTIVRELSWSESLFHWANIEMDSFFPIQIARFRVNESFTSLLPLDQIFTRAVVQLQSRYQVLSCFITKNQENNKYVFQMLDSQTAQQQLLEHRVKCIDKQKNMTAAKDEIWQQYAYEMVMRGSRNIQSATHHSTNETGLLWTVELLYDSSNSHATNEIIMTLDHAIADGQSFVILLNELLYLMECIARNSPIPKVYRPISIPIEDRITDVQYDHEKLPDEGNAKIEHSKPIAHPHECTDTNPPHTDRKANLAFKTLTPIETEKLIHACRSNNTTINGALCAAIVLSGYKNLYPNGAISDPNAFLSTYLSASLRNLCPEPIPKEEVGVFYTGFAARTYPALQCIVDHESSSDVTFWAIARDIQQQLQIYLSKKESLNVDKGIDWFNNVTGFMSNMEQHNAGRLDHFNVSNRGRIDEGLLRTRRDSGLMLDELFVTTSQWRMGNTLSCHAMSINGSLMFSLSSMCPFVTPELHEIIAEDMKMQLSQLS